MCIANPELCIAVFPFLRHGPYLVPEAPLAPLNAQVS